MASEITNGDEPAFARPHAAAGDKKHTRAQAGLTKREYFAAMAMQGYCASDARFKPSECARAAVLAADALIRELEGLADG